MGRSGGVVSKKEMGMGVGGGGEWWRGDDAPRRGDDMPRGEAGMTSQTRNGSNAPLTTLDGNTAAGARRLELSTAAWHSVVPQIRNPKPETQNPKPETRNPKIDTRSTQARNLTPETRNPKPPTRNPTPETRNPEQVPREVESAGRWGNDAREGVQEHAQVRDLIRKEY